MLKENLSEVLNKEQYEAVTYGDGPLLVLAGAGSGKTRVLTYRYAYLVNERYVNPYNILAITFTNKAAGEMKTRIGALLGESILSPWIGTFHACCGKILRRNAALLGYDSHFTIYAESESLETVKAAIKHLNLDDKLYPPKMLRALIGKFKDRMQTPQDVMSEAETYDQRINARVYAEYQNILKKSNCMDFDDMILYTVKLFEENPDVLNYYRGLFRYILVDEYQDTNKVQDRLVNILAGANGNLCVVGDDDQSIYSFRGAEVDNILNFEHRHPSAKVIKLEQNYRSTGSILKIANDLIKKNIHRTGKKLWTSSGQGAKAVCCMAQDHNEEAEFISAEIKKQVEAGDASYSDFAVLYRVNAVSTGIERVLTRMRIPYRVFGGMKFYDRKEIKDLVAYLRLLANPSDEASLRRIINVPKRGIGDTTVENISLIAANAGTTMFEVIRNIENYPPLARAKEKLAAFRALMAKLAVILAESPTLTEFTERVIDTTGLAAEYEAEHTPEGDAKAENIREFMSVTKTFEDGLDESYESAGAVFSEFLETVSLNSDLESDSGEDDAVTSKVTLTTIHSAKGLEFPVVFVAGLEDGVFPSVQSIEDSGSMAEERRLMYVAVTRAMKQLFLSCCSYRMLYGRTQLYKPSRFLRDIPAEDLELSSSGRGGYGSGYGSGFGSGYGSGYGGGYGSSYKGSYGNGYGNSNGSDKSSVYGTRRGRQYVFDDSENPFVSDNVFNLAKSKENKQEATKPAKSSTGAPIQFGRYMPTPSATGEEYLKSVAPGDRVSHKKFGAGTVSKTELTESGTVVEIIFDNAGMKRLILEYAKLLGL